jgi:hypothetical protein
VIRSTGALEGAIPNSPSSRIDAMSLSDSSNSACWLAAATNGWQEGPSGTNMNTLVLALLLLALPRPPAGQEIGSVTLLEGSLRVIRGTTTFQGAEGMSIRQGDMIESSAKGFIQFEFGSGAIIALGPSSRVYILQVPVGEMKGDQTAALDLVMLDGWFKGEFPSGKRSYRYRSPLLAATTTGGTVVVRSNLSDCSVFVESGTISIAEVNRSGNTGHSTPAEVGQFFSRRKGAAVESLARPSVAFVDAMPRAFRDTLPSRLGRYSGKPVEPRGGHPVAYGDVGHWLSMPFAWRDGLAERFAPRLGAADFRKGIEVHLKEFPEWEPLLHPKKASEFPQTRD